MASLEDDMADEPVIPETKEQAESQMLNVSTRGWIALALTVAVCFAAFFKTGYEECLKSGFLIALGFYFGQKTKGSSE